MILDAADGFHGQALMHCHHPTRSISRTPRRRHTAATRGQGSASNTTPEPVELIPAPGRRLPQMSSASLTRSGALRYMLGGLTTAVISASAAAPRPSLALESDEFEETFQEELIGIELEDVKFKSSSRVVVKRIVQGGAAAGRSRIKPDLVLVSANGASLERESAAAAKGIIKASERPLTLKFRDTRKFNELLKPSGSPSSDTGVNGGFEPITTKIVPEGPDQRGEQLLKLLSSEKSATCQSCQGAQRGDLLEIEYTGTLENGTVFDGSSITVNGREVVGRGGDTTLFFVLGKQPKGQFPPGWDSLLLGMCVEERRVISVPPILGYGERGMARRGIPPDATLLYDVKLVGVNGVNTCVL